MFCISYALKFMDLDISMSSIRGHFLKAPTPDCSCIFLHSSSACMLIKHFNHSCLFLSHQVFVFYYREMLIYILASISHTSPLSWHAPPLIKKKKKIPMVDGACQLNGDICEMDARMQKNIFILRQHYRYNICRKVPYSIAFFEDCNPKSKVR